jgi:clan AA aspartic protease (TIGR02281 family)
MLVASLYEGKINYSQFAKTQEAIDNRFSIMEQLLQNNAILSAQEIIAKASEQIPISNTPISSLSPEQPELRRPNEINLENHNGTYTLPVRINGTITIDFVLDSGASDVLIPADVFSTLVRTGTLSEKDLIGKGTATLADGSEVTTYSFVLRELKVGTHVVTDVTASIGPAASTPLLGQSYLSKFKSWTLDNNRHVLIISEAKPGPSREDAGRQTAP